jgi:hypothetical protein
MPRTSVSSRAASGKPLSRLTEALDGLLLRRVEPMPVFGHFAPGAEPHPLVLLRVFEEFDKPHGLSRTADQPIVQIDGHELRMLGAFFVEEIEGIHHVAGEAVGGAETQIAVEAVVVGFERRWDDQVVSLAETGPEGQLVTQIVAVVEKAAVFYQQAPRIDARTAVKPADRRLAGEAPDRFDAKPNVLALGLLVDL